MNRIKNDQGIITIIRRWANDWKETTGEQREAIQRQTEGYLEYSKEVPDNMRVHYKRMYELMKE